jgi:tripartite-type tricarboxylate transporter receptor subunit TctC
MNIPCVLIGALSAFLAGSAAAAAPAESYPSKPIRIVVPTPPGGGNDLMARMAAQRYTAVWNQPAVVDNRPGAGGSIAMEVVAKAAPDGYTLLLGTTNLVVLPSLTTVTWNPARDYAPVVLLATSANLLIVNPAVPARTVKELLALARAKPGELNYASGSTGSSVHLAAELMKAMANVNIAHVPYKGTGPAMTDVIGGQIHMMFNNPTAALPIVRQGRLRALATTGSERLAELPEVPTMAEAALPGYEASTWWGVLAPRGTPPSVIRALNREGAALIAEPDTRQRVAALGAQAAGGPPEALAAKLKTELDKWPALIRSAGIRYE